MACGPVLTEGAAAEAGDTIGVDDDPPWQWEPLPSACEPAPEDGEDPFATARACGAYDGTDVDHIPQVEVRILNRRDEPILVVNRTGGCGQPSRYFVADGSMGGRDVEAATSFCPVSLNFCGDWTGESRACHLCATLHPPTRIEPGGASAQTWNAWVFGEVILPAECNELRDTDEICDAPMPVRAGRFELRATAASVAECQGDCTCESDERGSCQLAGDGYEITDTPLVATATFDGKCESVDIVFD
jgi:hypothetical protein